MFEHVCKTCGKEFSHRSKNAKFCSRQCYYDSRKGVKRPEHGEKIRAIMLEKNESYKGTERAKNISKARTKKGFTPEQESMIIEGIEKYYYVTNPEILVERIGLGDELTGKARKDWVISLIMKYNTFFDGHEFFPIKIQRKSREEIDSILSESQYVPWDVILDRHDITFKEYKSILDKHSVQNYEYKTAYRQTIPEKIVQSLLDDLGVAYKREQYLKPSRFRFDFIIGNTHIIEVQGDYWHANKRLFNREDLNETQIFNTERDKEKIAFAIQKGYTLIEIWEMDLYHRRSRIRSKLDNILRGGEDNGKQHLDSEFF